MGETGTLTTGIDSGTAFTGTAGNDTFNAKGDLVLNTTTGLFVAAETLNTLDVLDGGKGTDTLNATITLATASATAAPTLNSIENVNLTFKAAGTVDLTSATGTTKVTVTNSTAAAAATVNGLGTIASIAVNNQKQNVDFAGSTATTLALGFDAAGTVGTTPAAITVDLAKTGVAAKATTMNFTMNNSNVTVNSTAADVAKTVTVAATGTNVLTLTDSASTATTITTTGAGSVDLSGASLSVVTALTAADGGLKATVTNATATAVTITTGAGVDTISAVGAGVKAINTGAGNDVVTIATSALAATATIDLGAGDDSLTFAVAPTTGATLNGGDGKDTLNMTKGDYATVSGYGANLAKITNFEVLSLSDMLTTATYNVGAITGIGSFKAAAGVAATNTAAVTGLVNNATVEITGAASSKVGTAETATFVFADITGTAGTGTVININGVSISIAAGLIATAADIATAFSGVTTAGNAVGTGSQNAAYTAAIPAAGSVKYTAAAIGDLANLSMTVTTGTATVVTPTVVDGVSATTGAMTLAMKTPSSDDTLTLTLNQTYTENSDSTAIVAATTHTVTATSVETLNVVSTGTASAVFVPATGIVADGIKNTLALTATDLVTLKVTGDQAFSVATANTQTKLATIDASALTAGATIDASLTTTATNAALTIKGSATAANTLTGSSNADTIVGGSAADTITGGAKGDTMTGNGGNDTFVFATGDSTIGTGAFDTIADFIANTKGNATTGSISANSDTKLWTGDVLQFDSGTGAAGAKVDVLTSAADATTFLANNHSATNGITAALDSTNNNLYVDNTGDGVADFFIHLTGVTTIDAAAFLVV